MRPSPGVKLDGAVLLALLMWPMAASATHGSWTAHHLVYWEEGTSQYGSYGDVGAQVTPYDFGHVKWERWAPNLSQLRDSESVTCWVTCGYRKTYTKYWPQSPSNFVVTTACARKGTHYLPGSGTFTPCSTQSAPHHVHSVTLS